MRVLAMLVSRVRPKKEQAEGPYQPKATDVAPKSTDLEMLYRVHWNVVASTFFKGVRIGNC